MPKAPAKNAISKQKRAQSNIASKKKSTAKNTAKIIARKPSEESGLKRAVKKSRSKQREIPAFEGHKDGFVLYPGLLKDELPVLRKIAKALASVTKETAGDKDAGHWNEGGYLFDDQMGGRVYKVQGCALINKKVRDLVFKNPKVLAKVNDLLPEAIDLDFFGTKFYPMWPNGGRSVGWHQDSHYFGTRNCPTIISCAVYLDKTDRENGCLRVIPGTHDTGIEYKHTPGHAKWKQGEWIDIKSEFGSNPGDVDMEVPAGSVVLFDARLVHGAHENTSKNRRRLSFFAQYCPRSLDFSWRGIDFSAGKYKDRHQA